MKLCADKQCRRAGIQLALSEFHRNRRCPDGRNGYCKECCLRRVHEFRDRKREYREVKRQVMRRAKIEKGKPLPGAGEPRRKRMVVSPILRVKEAVDRGKRTREEIQRSTRLSFDQVGDSLAVLAFDHQSVRIVRLGSEKVFVPRAA